jgi:Do/DeqQ family serine protease
MLKRVALSLLLVAAGFAAGRAAADRTTAAAPAAPIADTPAVAAPAPALLEPMQSPEPAAPPVHPPVVPDFTAIAGEAVKGVVNISSVQVVSQPNSPFADDPFFRYFFGDDVFGSRDRRSQSLGSGVIVSKDGYVVTNSHVVGTNVRLRQVTVALADNREVPGTVIGTDPVTDIALLKVDVPGLAPVPWGDSTRLRVGEWVLAIGSPFQLSRTVTAGIVSATGRANVGFADYEDFIQTDAAINPGNSGGALIDTRGQLVGINTGIFSQSGGYQGIGFAVPSILARRVSEDLIRYGEVRRGTIAGLVIDRLTPQIARAIGATGVTGVLVVQVHGDSQAYAAGLSAGDVITTFNGQSVEDPAQLFRMVADARIGSAATLTVSRSGRLVDVKVPIVGPARGQ